MKKNARRTSVKKSSPCPICRAPAVWIFRRKVLASFPADMHLCPHCDYMFLAKPGWLKDAYTRVINSMDTGCLERIIRVRDETALPIYLLRGGRGPWLDYGGGHGGYVRLMRDIGFDFYWYDPMAENLFAAGFEAPSAIAFEGVTCFECFEHFTDPRAELETMSSRAPRIVFSTELRPRSIPDQESWSYYGWEHGQHVGFHTQKSLGILGAAFGLQLVSSGAWLHAFLPQGEAESPAARLIRRGKLPLSAWQGKGMRALFRANTFARSLGRGRVISRDFVHPLRNVLGSKTDSDQRRMQSMAKRANP